ncbi:hypothetical protein V9T40_007015 [Parthenolecanium corni]|uniref:Integrase catalytic domain-containing protein n=1 Tax=Parthenolecanium corni TaxID=536013 RepID=A0AAN9TWR9_9HEMI
MDQKLTEALEMHSDVRRKFRKRRIVSAGIDDLWASDLLVMIKFGRQNRGYNYILNVIDTFSKYCFLEPLKTKGGAEVAAAFEKIILATGRRPQLLHCDRGKEYVNKDSKKILDKYGIRMYHTFNEEKSAIAERLNRTLNKKIKVLFKVHGDQRWLNWLPDIIREYNEHNIHRSIGMRPAEVCAANEEEVRRWLYPWKDFMPDARDSFSIGDCVRISRKKSTFEHKYAPNWTEEIFQISGVHDTSPATYVIKYEQGETILGKFYALELLKTAL